MKYVVQDIPTNPFKELTILDDQQMAEETAREYSTNSHQSWGVWEWDGSQRGYLLAIAYKSELFRRH